MIESVAKSLSMLCSVCLFGLLPVIASADTYRWVDDDGVVNYAEQKPRGVPEERVTRIARSSAARASSNAPASPAPSRAAATVRGAEGPASSNGLPPLDDRQQQMMDDLKQNEIARQEQIAKIRHDNCERSRRVLDNLSVNSRIRLRGDDGTERVMGEDERQQRIAEAQQGIVANCDS